MVRDIVVVEDARLRTKCPRVPKIDASVLKLIDDMVDTMREAPGIGLAAPQVGRAAACDRVRGRREPAHLVNPEIVRADGEQVGDEGCLSIPGYLGEVTRSEKVVVKGKNRNGKEVRIKAEGLLARCLQHEIDHIDGVLFPDRMADPTKMRKVEAEEAADAAEGGEPNAAGEPGKEALAV